MTEGTTMENSLTTPKAKQARTYWKLNQLIWMADIPRKKDCPNDGLKGFLKNRLDFKFERQ